MNSKTIIHIYVVTLSSKNTTFEKILPILTDKATDLHITQSVKHISIKGPEMVILICQS